MVVAFITYISLLLKNNNQCRCYLLLKVNIISKQNILNLNSNKYYFNNLK